MVFTAIAVGLAVAGMAQSAYAQHKAGQAQEAAGLAQQAASNSEADLADFNAKVADRQATDAVERGAQQESNFRASVRGAIGGQRAGIAANNVDVGFGSAVDVQADAAYLGELDALQIRTNAAREAWGYSVQASDLRTRAQIDRQTGVNQAAAGAQAATAANYGAVGTLIGGTANLLSSKYGFGPSPRVASSGYAGMAEAGGG